MASNSLIDNLIPQSDGVRYALLGVWERFDTLWYIHIAQHGYALPQSVVFYPLYPALIRLVSWCGLEPLASALLISTCASWFLFLGFEKLLVLDLSAQVADRGLLLLAVWPASFTLFAAYPESTVLALIIWSVYFARAGKWWWAGLAGGFAGLTKAIGVLVVIPLAALAWRNRSWRVLPAALCFTGPAAFAGYLLLTGRTLASEVYPRYWATALEYPWITLSESLRRTVSDGDVVVGLNLAVLAAVTAAALAGPRNAGYILYTLAAVGLFLTKRTEPFLQSTMRYVLILFPAFANLAVRCSNPRVFAALVALLFTANLILMLGFFHWYLIV
ncbi:MAG: hypothetical protein GY953_22045 [bacterium]|nr:hypothetical protein [bacterium]